MSLGNIGEVTSAPPCSTSPRYRRASPGTPRGRDPQAPAPSTGRRRHLLHAAVLDSVGEEA